jgi:hypothetical protein
VSRVAVYDACILFPATLRDLMLRLAAADLVQPRWSDRILDECFRNILLKRPELSAEALARTRMRMCAAFPDAMVADDATVGPVFGLPDADDVHVVEAAIRADAASIVTFNLRDFPERVLDPFRIGAIHPDDLVLTLLDEAPGRVCAVVEGQALALKKPPTTLTDLVGRIRNQGLPRSAARLTDLLGSNG